jgi:hypothetical protein
LARISGSRKRILVTSGAGFLGSHGAPRGVVGKVGIDVHKQAIKQIRSSMEVTDGVDTDAIRNARCFGIHLGRNLSK